MNTFLKQTFANPQLTGAVAPSSKRLANVMSEKAQLESANFVVELGPGTGVFTQQIIKHFPFPNKFFTIEINSRFAGIMKKRFLEIDTFETSAENIDRLLAKRGVSSCDRIISGLPWTSFEPTQQDSILNSAYDALETGGLFLTFAYFPFNHLKNGRSFKRKINKKFASVEKTELIWNFPRAFIYICRK